MRAAVLLLAGGSTKRTAGVRVAGPRTASPAAPAQPPAAAHHGTACAVPLIHHAAPPKQQFEASVFLNLTGFGGDGGSYLYGNDMGVAGHVTDLTQCSFSNEADGTFGWNWTRGTSEKSCATICPYPVCYYQFGWHGFVHGIQLGGRSSGASNMPQNFAELASFVADTNVDTYSWTDTKTPNMPPIYRSRLIFDFFLLNAEPKPDDPAVVANLTDEIVVMLNYNTGFELPCTPRGSHNLPPLPPLVKDALVVGGEHYDMLSVGHDEPSTGVFCQINTFARVGGNNSKIPPAHLDLLPFVQYVQKHQRLYGDAGTWVGNVNLVRRSTTTQSAASCSGTAALSTTRSSVRRARRCRRPDTRIPPQPRAPQWCFTPCGTEHTHQPNS